METFSLLKYWRGGGEVSVRGEAAGDGSSVNSPNLHGTASIVAALSHDGVVETDDDGPFFDLEFTSSDEADGSEDGLENQNQNDNGGYSMHDSEEDGDIKDDSDGDKEFDFTLSSGSSNERSDASLSLSPPEDMFFKGRLVPIEPSSETSSKTQFPVSLLKSATKFRVLTLGLKKPKTFLTEQRESDASVRKAPKQQEPHLNKLSTVKFKVEDVPIFSLFAREHSSRGNSGKKSQKQSESSMEEFPPSAAEEKRFSKEVMHKYLKKVKPLYVRVSRKYGDKLRFSGQLSMSPGGKSEQAKATGAQKAPAAKATSESSPSEASNAPDQAAVGRNQKQGSLPAGLRVVCKHLGKSRSASSAVAVAAPLSSRQDDSLLQQQDGIQSAILHCKRSFNSSREGQSSLLPEEISRELLSMTSSDGGKAHP